MTDPFAPRVNEKGKNYFPRDTNEKTRRQFTYARLGGIRKLSQSYARIRDRLRSYVRVASLPFIPMSFPSSESFFGFPIVLNPFNNPPARSHEPHSEPALAAGRDPTLFRYFLEGSRGARRDASPSCCRPDLARRARDVVRVRERRRAVETPPEKGRPRLYVPVGNSVLMPHGVSFVSTSTFPAACRT